MKTLVLANQKGGVGKSAIATQLAHYFRHEGRRVLAIDLDHQGNYSSALALSNRTTRASFGADALLTEADMPVPAGEFALVAASDVLMGLERQPTLHTPFARHFRSFLASAAPAFDVCVIDTHPIPDIRLIAALASADWVLAPIQLNQEAIDGVRALLGHPRVGIRKIQAALNPRLRLLGLLPTLVELTPFQRANLVEIVRLHRSLLIPLSERLADIAYIPRRSSIAEAQASGEILWEMKKTAAREAWQQIEPSIRRIACIVLGEEHPGAV